ncbi:MAG: hypothetical protein ABIK30_06915 [bacterium]
MAVNDGDLIKITVKIYFSEISKIIKSFDIKEFGLLFDPNDFTQYLNDKNSFSIEKEFYQFLLFENESDIDIEEDQICLFEKTFIYTNPEIVAFGDYICFNFIIAKKTTIDIRDFILNNFSLLRLKKLNKETFNNFIDELKSRILDEFANCFFEYYDKIVENKKSTINKEKSEFYDW